MRFQVRIVLLKVLEEKTELTSPEQTDSKRLKGKSHLKMCISLILKGTEAVLKNLSFHVEAGETVGIIGMTGSGKVNACENDATTI